MSHPGTYTTVEELPEDLRRELPVEAQELYRAVFNRVAGKEAASEQGVTPAVEREAHDAAMLRVRREFSRGDDGLWRRDPVGEHMDDVGPTEGR